MTPSTSRERPAPWSAGSPPWLLATFRRLAVAAAFWLAIVLPVVYAPLLLADGLLGADSWPALALVAAHAVAVVVGQGHSRE